jgi:YD repeat-containing protein
MLNTTVIRKSKTNILFSLTLLLLSAALSDANAQSTFSADLPVLIPASPDASAFVKAGVGNANLSTGAATASIPLYTIKLKDFEFPISLSYSTQGLKADEASSRVGLGWVLNATGMITRSVKGEPDEFSLRMDEPTDFLTDNLSSDALFQYYLHSTTYGGGWDTQPDEFQFNFNGHSGKFVLDDNFQPRITATNNIKTNVTIYVQPQSTSGSIDRFVITTTDGVKYTFGSNYEITSDFTFVKYDYYKQVLRTAFFLDKIELPNGEYINFNYGSIEANVATGITQTLRIPKENGNQTCQTCGALFPAETNYTTTENKVKYLTKYLTSITTSNGITINLTYAPNGTGMIQDNRLTNLEVVGQKKYSFSYYDVPYAPTTLTGRFFLTQVSDITAGTQISNRLNHNFSYDRLAEVPLPVNFHQDYLGFYNGSTGAGYLIPPAPNSMGEMDFNFRNPNSDAVKIGTLTKIEYPTGGTEEFIYEGNTVNEFVPRDTYFTYELSGSGGGSNGSPQAIDYANNSITVPFDQVVTLKLNTDDALPNDGYTADSTHHTASVWVYDGTTVMGSRSVKGYGSTSTTFSLAAGHTYQFKLTVDSYTEVAFASLITNTVDHIIYDTLQTNVPGLRLKQIRYTDPFTTSTHSKFYTYSSLEHLGQTSGQVLIVDFHVESSYKKYCGSTFQFETDCLLTSYTSSSTNIVYGYAGSGSPLYYRTVIESDHPDLLNGGTEYTFFENEDGVNKQLIRGNDIPYLTNGHYPTLSGVLFKTRIFNRYKEVIHEEQNEYETLIDLTGMPVAIYVRKNYEPRSPLSQDRCEPFDVVKIQYGNHWIRLKSKTVTEYSNGIALTQKTDYTYGTAANILPATVVTTDSKGQQLKRELKYPTITIEEPGADPALVSADHQSMVSRNQITPVIQESSFRNGTLLQQKRVLYKNWITPTSILAPEKIQLKRSASDVLQDALIYKQYDPVGNPSHFQKVNDLSMVYLWDAQTHQSIAEAANTLPDQVAYTSFENNALGNWAIVSGSVISTGPYTGGSCFSGTISKTISTAGTFNYVITLWTSSTTVPTANGVSGTKIRSSNGFDLYQWKIPITNSGTLTVVGTQIDEVRMFPEGAQMKTFTYKPFIGPTTMNDPNNRVTFYSYDALDRLQLVKDQDGNVIKTFDYHYKQQN